MVQQWWMIIGGVGIYLIVGIGIMVRKMILGNGGFTIGFSNNRAYMTTPYYNNGKHRNSFNTGHVYIFNDQYYRSNGPAVVDDNRWVWYLFNRWHRYYGPCTETGRWAIHGKDMK